MSKLYFMYLCHKLSCTMPGAVDTIHLSIFAWFFIKGQSNLQPCKILQSALSARLLHTSRCCISILSGQTATTGLFAWYHSQSTSIILIRIREALTQRTDLAPDRWLLALTEQARRSCIKALPQFPEACTALVILNTPRKYRIIPKIVKPEQLLPLVRFFKG